MSLTQFRSFRTRLSKYIINELGGTDYHKAEETESVYLKVFNQKIRISDHINYFDQNKNAVNIICPLYNTQDIIIIHKLLCFVVHSFSEVKTAVKSFSIIQQETNQEIIHSLDVKNIIRQVMSEHINIYNHALKEKHETTLKSFKEIDDKIKELEKQLNILPDKLNEIKLYITPEQLKVEDEDKVYMEKQTLDEIVDGIPFGIFSLKQRQQIIQMLVKNKLASPNLSDMSYIVKEKYFPDKIWKEITSWVNIQNYIKKHNL